MPSALINSLAISSCRARDSGSVRTLVRLQREDDDFPESERCGKNPFDLPILRGESKALANCLPWRMEGHCALQSAFLLFATCRLRRAGERFQFDLNQADLQTRRFRPC